MTHDDSSYFENGHDIYESLKEKEMFITTKRTGGVSTSDIITRIIQHFDVYIRRNLARGHSKNEFNISSLQVCCDIILFINL